MREIAAKTGEFCGTLKKRLRFVRFKKALNLFSVLWKEEEESNIDIYIYNEDFQSVSGTLICLHLEGKTLQARFCPWLATSSSSILHWFCGLKLLPCASGAEQGCHFERARRRKAALLRTTTSLVVDGKPSLKTWISSCCHSIKCFTTQNRHSSKSTLNDSCIKSYYCQQAKEFLSSKNVKQLLCYEARQGASHSSKQLIFEIPPKQSHTPLTA